MREKEDFDHIFCAQTRPQAELSERQGLRESAALAASFTRPEKAKRLLWKDGHVYGRKITGRRQPNKDVIGQAVLIG